MEKIKKYDIMNHRHIDVDIKKGLPLEAVDDIISRGDMASWLKFRDYCLNHPEILDDVLKITSRYIADPTEQKYHFWHNLSLFLKEGYRNVER